MRFEYVSAFFFINLGSGGGVQTLVAVAVITRIDNQLAKGYLAIVGADVIKKTDANTVRRIEV